MFQDCTVVPWGLMLLFVTIGMQVPSTLAESCQDLRPATGIRTFRSTVVDAEVLELAANMHDPELACIFKQALPNCLDTTILKFTQAKPNADRTQNGAEQDDTFIVTGDIDAMWLRDSMNQVQPYMRYAKRDPKLQAMLRGLLRRQTRQIHTDVYANAFKLDQFGGLSPNKDDHTMKPSYLGTTVSAMTPLIFERKYELDSLCSVLRLGAEYYSATGDETPFDESWIGAVQRIMETMRSQQKSTANDDGVYTFQRSSFEPTDTLAHGVGHPGAYTGMVRSAFRPSDDATQYPFFVPANAMAVVELRRTANIVRQVKHEEMLASQLETLAAEIDAGIQKWGIVYHSTTGEKVFAYEVDGYGSAYHMDDGNLPSLLSLPYLKYVAANNSVYRATRKVILNSTTNPYYFEGVAGHGVGSPHTGLGNIWPMGLILQALTADNDAEVVACLDMLKSTTANKWFIHESFNANDANDFTRPWFSWVNSLFGELIVQLSEDRPHLVLKPTHAGANPPVHV